MRRIVWGLNPFEFDHETTLNTALLLRGFWPHLQIYPYFVGSRLDLNIPLAFDVPEEQRELDYPLVKLKENLKKIGFPDLAEQARTIFEPTLSNRVLAHKMVDYAKLVEADAIVITTHARKGVERLVLGSFAETLVHTSPISVLTLNPNFKPRDKLSKVFYASDMSPRAAAGYEKLLERLDLRDTEIVYYHVHYSHSPGIKSEETDEATALKQELNRARSIAEKRGLSFTAILRENTQSIPAQILKEAESLKSDLLVLQASVGPIEAMLLGSVSRSVIRSSNVPVLILK